MEKFINQWSKDTRSGFGEGWTELGRSNNDIVALCRFNRISKDECFAEENPIDFFKLE